MSVSTDCLFVLKRFRRYRCRSVRAEEAFVSVLDYVLVDDGSVTITGKSVRERGCFSSAGARESILRW